MLLAFACFVTWVIDGDTFICRSGVHVRLAGIDAPEIEPCQQRAMVGRDGRVRIWRRRCTPGDAKASLHALIGLAKGRNAACEDVGRSYERVLAFCRVAGRDLSCAQIQSGYAVRRYSFGPMVCRRSR